MWYNEEAKKLYTVGLLIGTAKLDDGSKMENAVLLLNNLDEIKQFTGDDLCLDQGKSVAIGKHTNALRFLQLLILFGMLSAFIWS